METFIKINGREIGLTKSVYIIAEISANHHHDYEQTVKMIEAAKEAGADAVKVQTYTADTLTIKSDSKYFQIGGGTPWDKRNLYDLYQEAYMPWEWQPKLKAIADQLKIDFFNRRCLSR